MDYIYGQEALLVDREPVERQTPIKALRIGDLGIVGLPGEIFVEYGLQIKAQSPFNHTMTVELANDYVGYCPTDKALDEGSYETRLARSAKPPKAPRAPWCGGAGSAPARGRVGAGSPRRTSRVMRLAILADIHGNLPALEAVLADVWQQGGADHFVVAGDHLVGTPFPAQTLARVRALGGTVIAGNRDHYLLRFHRGEAPPSWHAGEQAATIRWTYNQLAADDLNFIASLPTALELRLSDLPPLLVVHGSPESLTERLYPDQDEATLAVFRYAGLLDGPPPPLEERLRDVAQPVVICGHTHIQWQQRRDGRLALNPGSVGETLDLDQRARYALLTGEGGKWQAEMRAVPYDVEATRRRFEASGMLAEGGGFARACLRNIETGVDFSGYFVEHAYAIGRAEGAVIDGALPDDVWRRAGETFDWNTGANAAGVGPSGPFARPRVIAEESVGPTHEAAQGVAR